MKLPQLIDELRQFLGLSKLSPDDDGIYWIVFDDSLEISISEIDSNHLVLRRELVSVPEDASERETLLRQYLQHNVARLREQTASLTRFDDGGKLGLARTLRFDRLTVAELAEQIESFLNEAAWWSQVDADANTSLPASAFSMPLGGMIRP